MQTRKCAWCGKPETAEPVEAHHVRKRSLAPELKDDPNNVIYLCLTHHRLTETSDRFRREVERIFSKRR